jgi:hypothetical protein
MNERIDALIDQMDQSGLPYQADNYSMTVTGRDLEYLAELIVKECASVCHTHGWGMLEHGMSGHNIADDCGTLIKEHFGVEE